MSESHTHGFALEAYFRAHPDYELIRLEHLESASLHALPTPLRNDPDMTSVLRPRIMGLRLKAVCDATAQIFAEFLVPAKLPASPEGNAVALMQLVFDDILQVQSSDGRFVSGAEAYSLFLPAHEEFAQEEHSISCQAIKYGAMLHIDNPSILAARLYCYNRRPLTASWQQRWRGPEQLLFDLTSGIDDLDQHWVAVSPPSDNPNWFVWRSRLATARDHRLTYKLYIAPHVEELSETMRRAFPVLAACGANSVKVGNNAVGILRPDKLVAYFADQALLQAAADALAPRLRDLSAQPVPFTCQFDSGGMLSWGIDPPKDPLRLPWEGTSWRAWITMRLALALIDAHHARQLSGPVWHYALNRVRLDGIDPLTWRPDGVFT